MALPDELIVVNVTDSAAVPSQQSVSQPAVVSDLFTFTARTVQVANSADVNQYIFPEFDIAEQYEVNDLVQYLGKYYRCSTQHTPAVWNPSNFTEITAVDDPAFWPESFVATAKAQEVAPALVTLIKWDKASDANLTAALNDAVQKDKSWFGVSLANNVTAEQEELSDWTESQEKMCAICGDDSNIIAQTDTTSIAALAFNAARENTTCYYSQTPYKGTGFGAMVNGLTRNPGSYDISWNSIGRVDADFGVQGGTRTDAERLNAWGKYCNTINFVSNLKVALRGWVSNGKKFDLVHFKYWLKFALQSSIVSLLVNIPSRKLSNEPDGHAKLYNSLSSVFKEGRSYGAINQNTFDDNGNQISGYFINIPKKEDQNALDVAAGVLKTVECGCWYNFGVDSIYVGVNIYV